jgi:pSer/pThr/pTyr-binding forkhead associated (FHA) protein
VAARAGCGLSVADPFTIHMPYLQIEDRQYPLLDGDTRVGRGEGADVPLPPASGEEGVAVVISIAPDQSASVRRVSQAAGIHVNGIPLSGQPALLFHGDRLEVGGAVAIFADEAQAGSTMQMAVTDSGAEPGAAGPRARANGRLVSMVDGREYTVLAEGLTIGRDAGCDIVVAVGEVSRRHARIELRPEGYVLVDTSTNGVLVNGTRIRGTHPLARGDTIRVGPEELRFHADVEPAAPAAPPPPPVIVPPPPVAADAASGEPLTSDIPRQFHVPPAPPPAPPPRPSVAQPPQAAPQPSAPPVRDAPARPARPRAPLATLEIINEGPTKGTRFSIVSALTHVGRGPHNDVVIQDESVSDSHAKLQRREDGWVVVDMDSTNGTYVGGERVTGEAPLSPTVDLRFGGVKVLFKTAGSGQDAGGGTRVIVGIRRTPKAPAAVAEDDADSRAGHVEEPAQGAGVPWFLTVLVVGLALAVIFLIVRSQ